MNILAIDTSTTACSAAVLTEHGICEQFALTPRTHTQNILPMLDTVLAQAQCTLSQLDALAFACGPGSFTGIRVAAGVIQGIGLATQLPIVPVSTLAALAHRAYRHHLGTRILTVMDARMQQVYWARFDITGLGQAHCLTGEHVSDPHALRLDAGELVVGDGRHAYAEQIHDAQSVDNDYDYPHAEDVCRLAEQQFAQHGGVDVTQALPVYLRNQVVQM